MSLLKTITPEEATGNIAEIYKNYEDNLTKVPNVIQMYSTNPRWLEMMSGFLRYYSENPNFKPEFFFLMRIIVANHYNGKYCIRLNSAVLKYLGYNQEEIEKVLQDIKNVKLEEKDKLLLEYAVKVATNSDNCTAEDVELVKKAGWNDMEIFDAVFNASIFSGLTNLIKALKPEIDF